MSSCTFCRIVSGEESARFVYRGDGVTAFHDQRPQAPTHLLIIPDDHIESVQEVEPRHAKLLGKLIVVARQLAEEEGLAAGYRLVINTGAQAGQSVQHLHVHLLGGRRMSWPPG